MTIVNNKPVPSPSEHNLLASEVDVDVDAEPDAEVVVVVVVVVVGGFEIEGISAQCFGAHPSFPPGPGPQGAPPQQFSVKKASNAFMVEKSAV